MARRRQRLRIGVIGTGRFAEECHLPGLQSHPHAKVVAICGRRPERLQSLAAQFKIPSVYTDYRTLCVRPDIDAITIVTPNSEHAAQAKAAFEAGKHVFCEKPMATDVRQAQEMIHAAEISGKIHQMAFTYRYLYGIQELRRRVRRGDIGKPYHLRAHHNSWDGLQSTSALGFRGSRAAGGGVLYDMGPHLFDLARFLFGPIQSVIGFCQHVSRPKLNGRGKSTHTGTDDMATAWFSYESGLRGQWFASRVMPWFGEKGHVEVVGDGGTLRASLSRGGTDILRVAHPSNPGWKELPLPREARTGAPSSLTLMLHSFVEACHRGKLNSELDASFHDGLAAQLAIASVQQSSASLPWADVDSCAIEVTGSDRLTQKRKSLPQVGAIPMGLY
ncbi:MAG: Gfo/Idh/MocA family oxidoreductase [Nitrospira sp.]|nr:Gfo/Idh/MocA family oxidoreductase [Nitrospira sp.]